MECEGQILMEEGREEGPTNGDDIMVEVLGSHVYVDGICTTDGGDGGMIGTDLNDEAVHGHGDSGEVDMEGLQNLGSEGNKAGDLGSRSEVSGGEAEAGNGVSGAGDEAGETMEHTDGIDGGGDANQTLEAQKVGDSEGNDLSHGKQKAFECSSAASKDSTVQAKVVEEAGLTISGENLNTLDGSCEILSDTKKEAADVGVDANSSDVRTQITAENVPHSDGEDVVYSCQSTESVVESGLDEKVLQTFDSANG